MALTRDACGECRILGLWLEEPDRQTSIVEVGNGASVMFHVPHVVDTWWPAQEIVCCFVMVHY